MPSWPEIWERMVTPKELRRLKARSTDGKAASWDDVGQSIKLNMFPMSNALRMMGEHVAVAAFQTGRDLNVNINLEELNAKLYEARERASKWKDKEERVDPERIH